MSDPILRGGVRDAPAASADLTGYDRRAGKRISLDGEQLDAVRAREPIVALSAGAGSGKTTVLVERFLDLVTSDHISPLDILAITYTERAAAEMKERIIRRFEERGDEENRRRAEAAYISTIHGFCARLLRENPLAAAIDPAFQIVDGMRLGFFLDEERERMLEDEWYLDARDLFAGRTRSGRDALFEIIRDCVFQSREFGKEQAPEESFDIDAHVAAAMDRLNDFRLFEWQNARTTLLGAADEIAALVVSGPTRTKNHQRLCELLGQLNAMDAPDAQWIDDFCSTTSFTAGVKDIDVRTSVKRTLDPVRKSLKDLAEMDGATQEEIECDVIAPLKVGIYRHARDLRERYDRMKGESALLDFEDLQRLALTLLQRDEIRAEYSTRFRHILLDEAQDTNEIQEAIVNTLLCGSNQCFFAVGDVKQSIYGFRGANVSIFRDIHRGAGAGRLELRDNYRSRPEVLDFVNAVGEWLWDDGASLDYQPLLPVASYQEMPPRVPNVTLMLIEKFDATTDVTNAPGGVREGTAAGHDREALALAQRIQQIVNGADHVPPIQVYDRDTGTYRDARYGDIAVLANRRTHFSIYERVFANLGIPVVADGGRGFFSGMEVQDILSALRVIANPFDEPALLAALRSPLFGWSDDDLVQLRLAASHDLWRAMRDGFTPTGDHADAGAYHTLTALRNVEQLLSPVRLINDLLDRTGYAAALLRMTHGRSAVANVDKLLEFARKSEAIDGPDLRRFIHRVELARDYLAQEQEAIVAAEGEDVVLLGTIHGSKGLEWPIVILADLESDFARSEGGSCYSAADGVLILQPKDEDGTTIKPASQGVLLQRRRIRAEQEARRLFYVGMTRAREYLILSGCIDLKDEPSLPDRFGRPIVWLAATLGLTTATHPDGEMSLGNARLHVTRVLDEDVAMLRGMIIAQDQALTAARRAVSHNEPVRWTPAPAERIPLIAAMVREVLAAPVVPVPRKSAIAMNTVTQLVYFKRCPMVYYFNLVLQIDEHRARRREESPGERRYSALELGTIVHEMLERADLTAPPIQEARRLASANTTTDLPASERERIEQMLTTVLSAPVMDRARRASLLEREYPFYMEIGGTTIHGVIDLVFADEHGRGVVLDYKSNDLTAPGRIDLLTRQYQLQIELYALAASKGGLIEPREATLYFLNRAEARTFDVDGDRLQNVEQDAAKTLARIARGAWDTEPGEKCRNCGYRKRGFCDVGKHFVE